jgi:hypothetical protein
MSSFRKRLVWITYNHTHLALGANMVPGSVEDEKLGPPIQGILNNCPPAELCQEQLVVAQINRTTQLT